MPKKDTINHVKAGIRSPKASQAYLDLLDKFNELLAKLDADGGVTDTDFESTLKVED